MSCVFSYWDNRTITRDKPAFGKTADPFSKTAAGISPAVSVRKPERRTSACAYTHCFYTHMTLNTSLCVGFTFNNQSPGHFSNEKPTIVFPDPGFRYNSHPSSRVSEDVKKADTLVLVVFKTRDDCL